MDFIKKEDFNLDELHAFVKQTFKDGLVPESLEEFEEMLSYETTDGSLCFANGEDKPNNEQAMIFFYPYTCAVPIHCRKNFKRDHLYPMQLTILEYQEMLGNNNEDMEYLETLRQAIKAEYNEGMNAIRKDLLRHAKYAKYCQDKIDEYIQSHGFNSDSKCLDDVVKKYKQVDESLSLKILNQIKASRIETETRTKE